MSRGRRVFVIGLLAVATVPVVWMLTRRAATEPLTPERLLAAVHLWDKRGPISYALDIEATGALHHVEVRNQVVVGMTTNGKDAPDRVWPKWNVEGLFGFLSEELSNLQRPEAAYGVTDPAEVTLRAAFDAETGLPARFIRHVRGQTKSFEWSVRLTVR